MEKLSREVLEKADELVDIIKESKEYKKYLDIRNKLEENTDIKDKINQVKKIQQELVKCEYHNDIEKAKILEKSLNKKKEELSSIPIYNEYLHSIDNLNESLKLIGNLEDYLQSITE